MPHNFQNLEIWKRGCILAEETYKAFLNSNDYEFRSQMVRASLSIPSNIAEGSERGSDKGFIRFLRYAKGSSGELYTQAIIAHKLNLISEESASFLKQESLEVSSMIEALTQRLSKV